MPRFVAIVASMIETVIRWVLYVLKSGRHGESDDMPEPIDPEVFPILHPADLSELLKKDSEFFSGWFVNRSKELFWQLITASDVQEIESIRTCLAEKFYQSCQNRCRDLQKRGVKNIYEERIELNAVITSYRVQNQQEYLTTTLQICTNCYSIDIQTEEIVEGDPRIFAYIQYELEFVRHNAENAPDKVCHHCGAPIEKNGQEQCSYCNSNLVFKPKSERQNWLLCKCIEKRYE